MLYAFSSFFDIYEVFMAKLEINFTKNYSMFSHSKWNRLVSEKHVQNLMQGIKKNNQLEINPIVVNSSWEVIDGQHRLEVAKRLKIPIYYVKKDFSDDNPYIFTANLYQNKCRMSDAIEYYADFKSDRNFQILRGIKKCTNLETGACLCLLGNPVIRGYGMGMYEGELKFNHEEHILSEYANKFIQIRDILSNSKDDTTKRLIKTVYFCSGFYKFLQLNIDWDHFISRLKRDWPELSVFLKNANAYTELLKKIYGKRCSKNKLD